MKISTFSQKKLHNCDFKLDKIKRDYFILIIRQIIPTLIAYLMLIFPGSHV